ncbi:MAG: hypothetical protein HY902_15440 [Deltaproteobacteria bacterium]|nr:hypothetical protein [Deltaproteobacteria bacterium]
MKKFAMIVAVNLAVVGLGCAACGSQGDAAAGAADAAATADSGVSDAAASDTTVAAGPQLPTDRPILLWSDGEALAQNAPRLPANFDLPDQAVCAKDPTRQYIGEIFKYGINNVQVDWHWAPVVAGPDAKKPTLKQPEFNLAGALTHYNESGDDVLADHPFGLDTNADVKLDADFAYLGRSHKDEGGEGAIHAELEHNIFPRQALGMVPAKGDRTLMRGVWVLDCGHPPYGTEMHPPSFVAFARPSTPETTQAMLLFAPYRSSLLFNPSVELATKLDDDARFADLGTASFPHALVAAVIKAVASKADYVTAHALMVANRFETLHFSVCAPLPRPAGAHLQASWRLTSRSGVTLTAAADDAQGCVHITAVMDQSYKPMPLTYANTPWPWDQLSASAGGQLGASVDVRAEVVKIAKKMGLDPNAPALQADHPPRVDAYAMLELPAGADQDAPTAIQSGVDTQAFPFFGRVKAGWQ